MYVKRKSNWYIYFIAFGITLVFAVAAILAFKWYLFPGAENTGADNTAAEDFRPSPEYNFSVLAMLSDGFSSTPDFFYMIEFNAVENKVVFIPLPMGLSVGSSEGRSLSAAYAALGPSAVVNAVEEQIGIKCGAYVKMDRYSFVDLLNAFGDSVEYVLPKTVIVRDFDNIMSYTSGKQYLTSDGIYQLIMNGVYEDGELFRFRIAGDILSEVVNQNYNDINSDSLDSYFRIIMDKAETDITEADYKKFKAAILNTAVNGISPAEFYIPYGEYTSDGGFDIADNSILTIKQKGGLA